MMVNQWQTRKTVKKVFSRKNFVVKIDFAAG